MYKIGEIRCEVFMFEDNEKHGKVRIHTECDEENEFMIIMMSAEFLTHLTAQNSKAGYEQALDLVRKGAMTYKTSIPEDLPEGE